MNQLNIKTSKAQFILLGLLGLFFVPVGLWMLITAVLNNFKSVPLLLGLLLPATFALLLWLVVRGYSKSIKYFTAEGLTRNDGKQLAWANLSRVVNQIRLDPANNRKKLWRTEIQFTDGGVAWIIPSKVVNIRCEHKEINV